MSTSNQLEPPSTPKQEPAFKINAPARLLRSAGPDFPKGTRVTIVRTRDMNSTNNTAPLTSFNASYQVSVSVRKEFDLDGDEIKSAKVDHARLSKSRNGAPSNELYQQKELVFLVKDWEYKHKGNTCKLSKGTKVRVCDQAQTRTGGRTTNTATAFYFIRKIITETKVIDVHSPKYVPHSELERI
ncbi:hypothetical protein JB92DRAFT_3123498 [Gautieria morchelliformis]|nr:hypothetical protein JB92DRAFT_3123498 [Gautieria morchelliformis]